MAATAAPADDLVATNPPTTDVVTHHILRLAPIEWLRVSKTFNFLASEALHLDSRLPTVARSIRRFAVFWPRLITIFRLVAINPTAWTPVDPYLALGTLEGDMVDLTFFDKSPLPLWCGAAHDANKAFQIKMDIVNRRVSLRKFCANSLDGCILGFYAHFGDLARVNLYKRFFAPRARRYISPSPPHIDPVLAASFAGHLEIVRSLMEDPSLTAAPDWPVYLRHVSYQGIQHAVLNNQVDVVNYWLSVCGTDTDLHDSRFTFFVKCCTGPEALHCLIKKLPPPAVRVEDNESAAPYTIDGAAKRGFAEIVRTYISLLDTDFSVTMWISALESAIRARQVEVIEVLWAATRLRQSLAWRFPFDLLRSMISEAQLPPTAPSSQQASEEERAKAMAVVNFFAIQQLQSQTTTTQLIFDNSTVEQAIQVSSEVGDVQMLELFRRLEGNNVHTEAR